jgi:hypothetical protein
MNYYNIIIIIYFYKNLYLFSVITCQSSVASLSSCEQFIIPPLDSLTTVPEVNNPGEESFNISLRCSAVEFRVF